MQAVCGDENSPVDSLACYCRGVGDIITLLGAGGFATALIGLAAFIRWRS